MVCPDIILPLIYVAPLAGARIEINAVLAASAIRLRRSPRGSED